MDLHEDAEKNAVTATFELPGMKKEDVQIDVHDGQLTISGETKVSEEHNKDGYAVRERRFGKFSRTLRLPQGVNVSGVQPFRVCRLLVLTIIPIGGRNQGCTRGWRPYSLVPEDRKGGSAQEDHYFLNTRGILYR